MIWLAIHFGTDGAKPAFFEDMLQLFKQLKSKEKIPKPSKEKIESWMNRYPSGIDPRIIKLREEGILLN